MIDKINAPLRALAARLDKNLYLVGGIVRNFLIDGKLSGDLDLASANTAEELSRALGKEFSVAAVYPRTGTIMFKDAEGRHYEHTTFRGEEYEAGGAHTPARTFFTDDIVADALRRDFKCNAVYYDLKNGAFADPLGGMEDIKNKKLDTVAAPQKVFSSDGLRLLRLCRFAGELGFCPTKEVKEGARKYARNIDDIAAERIFAELSAMLVSDTKYSFSDQKGHYVSLKLCHEIGVFERILPELAAGDKMKQRSDFHDHDVLEHSFRTVLYAVPSIRFAALLHDVGKPYAMNRYGAYKTHADDGERIAREVLLRLKAYGGSRSEDARKQSAAFSCGKPSLYRKTAFAETGGLLRLQRRSVRRAHREKVECDRRKNACGGRAVYFEGTEDRRHGSCRSRLPRQGAWRAT